MPKKKGPISSNPNSKNKKETPSSTTQISRTQEEKKDPLATTTSGKKPENASGPE
jgi:hypothetical protein